MGSDHATVALTVYDEDLTSTTFSRVQIETLDQTQAAILSQHFGVAKGERVLICMPNSPEFFVTFLACIRHGAVAVPYPIPRYPTSVHADLSQCRTDLQRMQAVVANSGSRLVLTTARVARLHAVVRVVLGFDLPMTVVDVRQLQKAPLTYRPREEHVGDDVAFIQYTSGSTGTPKGVVITRSMLDAATNKFATEFEIGGVARSARRTVSWLPVHHDMGLIAMLQSFRCNVPFELLSPLTFMTNPSFYVERLARDASETVTFVPSFALGYMMKRVGVACDLSHATFIVGSDKVTEVAAQFQARFRADVRPTYGQAENVCHVTGGLRPTEGALHTALPASMAAGDAVAPVDAGGVLYARHQINSKSVDTVRIVDPTTLRACAPGVVGELWYTGACRASQYWDVPESDAMNVRIAGEREDTLYNRSGDLAVVLADDLYIVGRLRNCVKIGGRAVHLEDVEVHVRHSVSGVRPGGVCCSAAPGEREAVILFVEPVQERDLDARDAEFDRLATQITAAVYEASQCVPEAVVLCRRGLIEKTTSGKLRRGAVASAFEANPSHASVMYVHRPSAGAAVLSADDVAVRLQQASQQDLSSRAGSERAIRLVVTATLEQEVRGADTQLSTLGLSSMRASVIQSRLQAIGLPFSIADIVGGSIGSLAQQSLHTLHTDPCVEYHATSPVVTGAPTRWFGAFDLLILAVAYVASYALALVPNMLLASAVIQRWGVTPALFGAPCALPIASACKFAVSCACKWVVVGREVSGNPALFGWRHLGRRMAQHFFEDWQLSTFNAMVVCGTSLYSWQLRCHGLEVGPGCAICSTRLQGFDLIQIEAGARVASDVTLRTDVAIPAHDVTGAHLHVSTVRLRAGATVASSAVLHPGCDVGKLTHVLSDSVVARRLPADTVWGGRPLCRQSATEHRSVPPPRPMEGFCASCVMVWTCIPFVFVHVLVRAYAPRWVAGSGVLQLAYAESWMRVATIVCCWIVYVVSRRLMMGGTLREGDSSKRIRIEACAQAYKLLYRPDHHTSLCELPIVRWVITTLMGATVAEMPPAMFRPAWFGSSACVPEMVRIDEGAFVAEGMTLSTAQPDGSHVKVRIGTGSVVGIRTRVQACVGAHSVVIAHAHVQTPTSDHTTVFGSYGARRAWRSNDYGAARVRRSTVWKTLAVAVLYNSVVVQSVAALSLATAHALLHRGDDRLVNANTYGVCRDATLQRVKLDPMATSVLYEHRYDPTRALRALRTKHDSVAHTDATDQRSQLCWERACATVFDAMGYTCVERSLEGSEGYVAEILARNATSVDDELTIAWSERAFEGVAGRDGILRTLGELVRTFNVSSAVGESINYHASLMIPRTGGGANVTVSPASARAFRRHLRARVASDMESNVTKAARRALAYCIDEWTNFSQQAGDGTIPPHRCLEMHLQTMALAYSWKTAPATTVRLLRLCLTMFIDALVFMFACTLLKRFISPRFLKTREYGPKESVSEMVEYASSFVLCSTGTRWFRCSTLKSLLLRIGGCAIGKGALVEGVVYDDAFVSIGDGVCIDADASVIGHELGMRCSMRRRLLRVGNNVRIGAKARLTIGNVVTADTWVDGAVLMPDEVR